MMGIVIILLLAAVGILNQWEQKQEKKRKAENERLRLAPYKFCNHCGTPLGDGEKIQLGSTVCCFDCAMESMRELRPKRRRSTARADHDYMPEVR